jgi:hypothetical protein
MIAEIFRRESRPDIGLWEQKTKPTRERPKGLSLTLGPSGAILARL